MALTRRGLLAGAAPMGALAAVGGIGAANRALPSVASAVADDQLLPTVIVAAATGDPDVDTKSIRDAIDATRDLGPQGISGGRIDFPPGEWVINDTILFDQYSGIVRGNGCYSNSPVHPGSPGSGTVIRWDGPAGLPMWLLRDYRGLEIKDIRFEGNNARPPSHGILSFWEASKDGQGTGDRLLIDRCHIGTWRWTATGETEWTGAMERCVGFEGENGNNDEFCLRGSGFYGALDYAVAIPNTQSIWGLIEDCNFERNWGPAALMIGSSCTVINFTCDLNETDLKVINDSKVIVMGWWSERNKHQYWDVEEGCSLSVFGGKLQMNDTANASGSGPNTLEGAEYLNAQNFTTADIAFSGVNFWSSLDVSPKMYIRGNPASTNGVAGGKAYRYHVSIHNCRGLTREMMDIQGYFNAGHCYADISNDDVQVSTTITRKPLSTYCGPQLITGNYTPKSGEVWPILCGGNATTITLPPVDESLTGFPFIIANVRDVMTTPTTGKTTVQASPGETIDNKASISLNAGESRRFFTNGVKWVSLKGV